MNTDQSAPLMNWQLSKQITPLAVRVPEACRLTGIGRSKLYELIKAGELQPVKIGAITLIPMSSLKVLLGLSEQRRR